MSRLVATKYKHDQNMMTIDWYVGKRCNFSCSYCADFIHDNYSSHVPFEKMKIFVDKITQIYGTKIHWSLTGGEPTINPDFLKLCKYLQDKKGDVSVCTNGSRSLDYLFQMYELVDNIVLSLHFEHISKQLDQYAEKALALEKWRMEWNRNIPAEKKGWGPGKIRPKTFILRFMVVPGFSKEINDLSHRLSSHFQKVEYRVIRPQKENFVDRHKVKTKKGFYKWKERPDTSPISQNTKVAPNQDNISQKEELIQREQKWYSEEDRKTMEKFYKKINPNRKWLIGFIEKDNGDIAQEEYYYNDLNYQGKTKFTGWTCYAGVRLLKIAPNGDIFIANCFQGGALGNIYSIDDNFEPPKEPVICKKFRCTDPLDLRQVKYIDKKYKHLIE
ncbi:MAG: radical SAM protein [Bdellovibrionales bacterium]|nr:radical SAM protein [Bdellovibrionales bacterium]